MSELAWADINWSTVLTTTGAGLVTVGTMLGAAARVFLGHLKTIRDNQYEHESAIMENVTSIVSKFNDSIHALHHEQRQESRETVNTLLKVQSDNLAHINELHIRASDAMNNLSLRVSELGTVIHELRSQIMGVARPDQPHWKQSR